MLMTRSLMISPQAESTYYSASNVSATLDRTGMGVMSSASAVAVNTQAAVDFSFTKAAKAKISTWLCKNMSLRRRRDETVAVCTSSNPSRATPIDNSTFRRTKHASRRGGGISVSDNKLGDVETLSASVDFSEEDDTLVLTKNDFRVIPRKSNS